MKQQQRQQHRKCRGCRLLVYGSTVIGIGLVPAIYFHVSNYKDGRHYQSSWDSLSFVASAPVDMVLTMGIGFNINNNITTSSRTGIDNHTDSIDRNYLLNYRNSKEIKSSGPNDTTRTANGATTHEKPLSPSPPQLQEEQQQSIPPNETSQLLYDTNSLHSVDTMSSAAATPLVPFRNDTIKELAQRCVMEGHGGVYVKHFRKAAGTAMYQAIRNNICHNQNLLIPTYGSEYPFFNSKTFDILGTSVFVTAVRHPVDRIESLYWFEGRWPRTCHIHCENNKTKDETTAVASFHDWIEHVHDQTKMNELAIKPHTGCGQWQSVENYYIRMLVGMDQPDIGAYMRSRQGKSEQPPRQKLGFLNRTVTRNHLEQAKRILESFDLVLIQEQLSNNHDMIRCFHSIIGVPDGHMKTKMPKARIGTERSSTAFRPMTDQDRNRLKDLNALDIELYEYALSLSAKQVSEWKERQVAMKKSSSFKSFDANKSCIVPPRVLQYADRQIAFGKAPFCVNAPWTTLLGKQCMQHSLNPSGLNRKPNKTIAIGMAV